MAQITPIRPTMPLRCSRCGVYGTSICAVLDQGTELAALSQQARTRHFKAGDVILSDAAPMAFLGTILSGTVKLEKVLADGRAQIVGLLFPSDFLGRAYALQCPYYAIALEDVSLCSVEAGSFHQLLARHSCLEHALFERTLTTLDEAREWMVLLGQKSAHERVASFLHLVYCHTHKQSDEIQQTDLATAGAAAASFIDLKMKRTDIADFLGLTIETVSRQMTHLRQQGLLQQISRTRYLLPDPARLDDIASGAGG